MIRFICIAILLFLYLVLGIPVLIIEYFIGLVSPKAKDYSCLRMVQWTFRLMLKIAGVKVTVIGEENIPDEPVLYIGNHRSYFDILLTYSRCRRLTGYVAKKEMLRYPLLRDWMRNLYCLFLDRSTPREGLKTILTAIDYVKKGVSICIFPEGTRTKGEEGSMLPFHDGALKIAEKTGCAIIPMSMNNTQAIFEAHLPFVRRTHVILEYGAPIYPDRLDKETRRHLGSYCQNIIQETILKNRDLV